MVGFLTVPFAYASSLNLVTGTCGGWSVSLYLSSCSNFSSDYLWISQSVVPGGSYSVTRYASGDYTGSNIVLSSYIDGTYYKLPVSGGYNHLVFRNSGNDGLTPSSPLAVYDSDPASGGGSGNGGSSVGYTSTTLASLTTGYLNTTWDSVVAVLGPVVPFVIIFGLLIGVVVFISRRSHIF